MKIESVVVDGTDLEVGFTHGVYWVGEAGSYKAEATRGYGATLEAAVEAYVARRAYREGEDRYWLERAEKSKAEAKALAEAALVDAYVGEAE